MNKSFLYILAIVVALSANGDMPQNKLTVIETADPSQDGADKKAWINILQVYGQFRQTANALIKDIKAVMDLAWSAQRQLEAVEAVANRVESISHYIANYRFDNATQFVKDMEENVFRESDLLIYSDIPNIGIAYGDLLHERDDMIKDGKASVNSIVATSQTIYNATAKQFVRIFGEKTDSKNTQRSLNNTLASSTIASHTAMQVSLDNQGTILSAQTNDITNSNGKLTPDQMAESNITAQRNELLINYQSNEYQSEKITTLSMILLEKTRRIYAVEKNKEKTVFSSER